MTNLQLLMLAAASLPWAASVQAAAPLPPATDAKAPVAPLQYRSAFEERAATPDTKQSPDKFWIEANQQVTGTEGHAGHGNMSTAPAVQPQSKSDAAHKGHKVEEKRH
jgi:hypothetical protein